MPETEIEPVETAPEPPAPDAPTTAEIMSTLEAERIARLQMQQENERLRANMYMQRPEPQRQQGPDLNNVVSNFITDPQAAAQGLQSHIQSEAQRAAREAAAAAAAQTEARMRYEMENQRNANLIANAQARYPEFQNTPVMVGAVAQAVAEAQAKGLQLPNDQIIERAARIVRRGAPGPAAPYVEGSGSGAPVGSPSNMPQQPLEPNMLEELYGAEPGEIVPLNNVNMVEFTARSVKADNDDRIKHGITPSGSVSQPKERKRVSA